MGCAELPPLDFEAASWREYDPAGYRPALFRAGSSDSTCQTLREHLFGWK